MTEWSEEVSFNVGLCGAAAGGGGGLALKYLGSPDCVPYVAKAFGLHFSSAL